MRDVLRNPVQNFDYFARSHAVDRRVIAEVTGILVFWAGPCRSYTIDQTITYPINRIALRNKRSPTIERIALRCAASGPLCVRLLKEELDRNGVRSKIRVSKDGVESGGQAFS